MGGDGSVKFRNGSPRSTQVIVDIAGYYLAPSSVPAPAISAVSPITGPSTGGVLVTIWGTNFTDVAAVTFDGAPGSGLTVVSPSQLTVVSPAHSAGTADVNVFTSGGTATTPGGFTYVATPPPGSYVANPVTSGAYCAQNVACLLYTSDAAD